MILRPAEAFGSGSPLEHELNVYGRQYSIDTLREPFLETPAAYLLADMQPRFAGNGYVWDDQAKFREYMGMDVDPLQHGPYQARTVGIPMVEAQAGTNSPRPISKAQARLFVAHHVQHDDHEGLYAQSRNMTHDVAVNHKTTDSEAEEYSMWINLQLSLFDQREVNEHIEAIDTFANPQAPDSFQKRFWNIGERIGYLFSALRAWDVACNVDDLTPLERRQVQRMAVEVTGRHLSMIEAARNEIVFADDVIIGLAGQIKEIKRVGGMNGNR